MGLDSSPRTATISPPVTSTRTPQLWLQRTHTVGRSVASDAIGVRDTEGSTAIVLMGDAPFDYDDRNRATARISTSAPGSASSVMPIAVHDGYGSRTKRSFTW